MVRYRTLLNTHFGRLVDAPRNPDERDQYNAVKRMLERRLHIFCTSTINSTLTAFAFLLVRSSLLHVPQLNISAWRKHADCCACRRMAHDDYEALA